MASALASLTYNNMKNQMLAASMGALKLVVDLMQDREFGIRYKAALAIEALAMNNVENQKQFLSKQLNVQKPLNELMEVKKLRRSNRIICQAFLFVRRKKNNRRDFICPSVCCSFCLQCKADLFLKT